MSGTGIIHVVKKIKESDKAERGRGPDVSMNKRNTWVQSMQCALKRGTTEKYELNSRLCIGHGQLAYAVGGSGAPWTRRSWSRGG